MLALLVTELVATNLSCMNFPSVFFLWVGSTVPSASVKDLFSSASPSSGSAPADLSAENTTAGDNLTPIAF